MYYSEIILTLKVDDPSVGLELEVKQQYITENIFNKAERLAKDVFNFIAGVCGTDDGFCVLASIDGSDPIVFYDDKGSHKRKLKEIYDASLNNY